MAENPQLAAKYGDDALKHIASGGGGFGPVRIHLV